MMKPNSIAFKRYFLLICVYLTTILIFTLSIIFFINNVVTNSIANTYIFISIFIVLLTFLLIWLLLFFYKKLNLILKHASETIHRYDALSNATNDAIWDVDLVTNAVFYNERVSNIFGFDKADLKNNTEWWETNIHPDDKDRVLVRMNGFLEKNINSWEDEYRFKCKDGEYKNVFDRSFIVRDNSGKPVRLIGAMKDVTKMRTMEKLLFDKKLQHKNILGKNIIAENESERKHVKDMLHEDVSQILVSVKYFLSMLKTGQKQENVTTSILYLDEVINKINNISNKLFSSTFDIFGLKDGINDLRLAYEREFDQSIKLDLNTFEETSTDKNLSLQLYRIIEDRLAQIINQIKGREVIIRLSNRNDIVLLDISFTSEETDVLKKLNSDTSNLFGKIELYDGKIKMLAISEIEFIVSVIFNKKGNIGITLEDRLPWL